MKGLTAVNMSQPELNDMDIIFDSTIDKGINIIGLSEPMVKQSENSNRDLRGLVHVEYLQRKLAGLYRIFISHNEISTSAVSL